MSFRDHQSGKIIFLIFLSLCTLRVFAVDISLEKAASSNTVARGDNLIYTITIKNNESQSSASEVTVNDALPEGFNLQSVSSSQGGCSTLPCNLGTLDESASATVTIHGIVDVSAPDSMTNNAVVRSAESDPDPSNNADSVTVTVTSAGEEPPIAGRISGRSDLTPNERLVARAVETLCPQLAQMQEERKLTADENDLLEQCTDMVVNADSVGIPNTMEQITTEKAIASTNASLEAANQQLTNISSRLAALRRGTTGISVQGLTLNIDGQRLSGDHVNSLVGSLVPDQASGGGASGDNAFGPWGLFINGSLQFGDKDRTNNEAGFDFDTKGITAGVDYRFTSQFVAGGALGFARSDVDFDSDGGDLDTDTWAVSAYGTYYVSDRFYVEGILGYGWHDYSSKRNIQYNVSTPDNPTESVDRRAKGDYDGTEYGGSLGAGYNFNKDAWTFGLYGRANYVKVDVDDFREKNAGGLNLRVKSFDTTSVSTTVGGQISRAFSTKKAVLVPQARFEWEHEFDDDATQLDVQFESDPTGTVFNILTDDPDRDYFRLGLGLTATFAGGTSAFVNYATLIDKDDWTDHAIDVGVRWEF